MWSFICKHSASTAVKLSPRNSLHHGGAILTTLHHNNNFNHKSLHHHHNSFHTFLNHNFPKSQSTTTTTTTDANDATTTPPPTVTIPIELLRGTLSHVREYLSASTIYRNQIHEQQTASATGINEENVGQMYQEPSANFSVSAIDMLEHSITQLIAQVSSMKHYSTKDLFTMLQFLYVVTEWRSYESQLSNDNDASQARTLEMHQKDKLLYIKCLQLSEYLIHRSTNEIKLINSNSSSSGNSSRLLEMVQLSFSVLCIRLQSSFHLGDIAMMKSCYQDALKYLKREITVYGQRKNKSVSDSHFTSLHLDLNNVSALFSSAPHLGLYEDMLFIGDVMKRCYPSGKFEEVMAGFHESADSVDTYFDYSAIYQLLTELFQKNGSVENYEYEEETTASSKTKTKKNSKSKRDTMKAGQFEVKNLMFNHLETKETGNTLAHKQFSDYSNFSDENEWINIDYELPTLLTHGRAVLWYQLNGGIPLAGIQMKNGDIHVAGFRDMSGSDIAPVEDIEQPDSQQQQSQPQQDNSLSEEDVESYREEMIKELEKGEETLTDPAERAQVTEMIDKFNDPNKLLADKEDEEIDFQSLKVHVHFHFVPQDKATNSFTGRYYRKLHAVKEGSKDEAVIKFIFDMKADVLPLQQEEN